jgi:hypothetical protein
MMAVMLVAGIGLLLAGLVTIGLGIQVDLSFGNTLILAGVVTACTGVIMLGLWMAVRELKDIARRLGPAIPAESHARTLLEPAAPGAAPRAPAAETDGFPFSRDQQDAAGMGRTEPAAQPPPPGSSPAWREEAVSRDRMHSEMPEPAEAAPAVKPRRNLLFSSTSRKERERAQARTSEPMAPDLPAPGLRPAPPVAPPVSESRAAPAATFDDAWPKPERSRVADAPLPRRGGRAPSTFADAGAEADRPPPPARDEDQPPVTVLKSGVVDGMAYSLYSDGSIEAQMPEGLMRFASIDELRSHLDHRP